MLDGRDFHGLNGVSILARRDKQWPNEHAHAHGQRAKHEGQSARTGRRAAVRGSAIIVGEMVAHQLATYTRRACADSSQRGPFLVLRSS